MHRRSFDGTQWNPSWENLGGTFISAPGAYEHPNEVVDLVAVGLDFAMYHRSFAGAKEGGWERLGGTFSSTVSAVSFDIGRLDVFARGADFTLRHRSLAGFTWSSDWQNLGGSLASPPSAVSWGPERLDVFAAGVSGGLIHRSWDGTDWQPPAGQQVLPGWDQVLSVKIGLPTRYRFSVDLVHVTTTRSLDSDTDAAQASVGAGNWPTQTKTQWIGDIGGLTNPKESQTNLLDFEPVTIELCEAVVFNYLVVNNGHADQKSIDAALVKAGQSLASAGASSISKDLSAGIGAILGIEVAGTILAPVIGGLLGSLAGWLLGQLGDIVFADCDGLVAAEQPAFTGQDLYLKTASGPLTTTTTHAGTPAGCGDPSQYEVTWTISQV